MPIFNARGKIVWPIISFKFNTTDIDNKYNLYPRTCVVESCVL